MAERRQYPRYPATALVYGRVRSSIPARIVDISQGGIQLELTSSLRPGTTCEVIVPTVAGSLQLRAAVRRCRARSVHNEQGTRLLYYAGLEFEGLDDLDRRALSTGLDTDPSATLELGSGTDAGLKRKYSA